jgi:ABC-type nitrate/sulfonate/bicarbonate transport system substrate-binding protein
MQRNSHLKNGIICGLAAILLAACGGSKDAPNAGGNNGPSAKPAPVFSLAWSEYPSWSTFGVAHEKGIINGEEGRMGPVEHRYNVDIVLHEAGYDATITMYGSGQTDAVTITNMDVLSPSATMKSVAILPTSTSFGGDALITTSAITGFAQLKGTKVYGLSKSVSEYAFNRCLEANGQDPAQYTFEHMDPEAAALAMQQRQADQQAIMVWNPFVIDTLEKRSDASVLCDSTKMPNEIIDMVVVSDAALKRPGGDRFAKAVVAAYYELNKVLAASATHTDTLMALGEKFTGIKDPKKMEVILQQTRFYATPEAGIAVFQQASLAPIMGKVTTFCVDKQIVDRQPTIGYGAASANAQLRFDPSFMEAVKAGQ